MVGKGRHGGSGSHCDRRRESRDVQQVVLLEPELPDQQGAGVRRQEQAMGHHVGDPEGVQGPLMQVLQKGLPQKVKQIT